MVRVLILGSIFLFCAASSCETNPIAESVRSVWVKNNDSIGIFFLASRQYPDTTVPDNKIGLRGVAPGKANPYDFHERNWAEVFKKLPADTLSIFIISGDTLATYSWQQIRQNYKIIKRYDLSLPDLERMNFTLVYP